MLEHRDLEKILEDKQRKFQELLIRNEGLDRETAAFLQELKVTPEQLTAYIANKENFNEKNWKELSEVKNKLDSKLDTELNSVRNPRDVAKAYSTRKVDSHWLYVR